MTPVDRAEFRRVMARWPTGVCVLTASHAGRDSGLTVNAFFSLSLDPPTVVVSLGETVDTIPVLRSSRRFALNLLGARQRELSERFARSVPGNEKFQGVRTHRSGDGPPLLDGALATLDCRLVEELARYDHRLLIGEVERIDLGVDAPPLVFYHRGYATYEPDGRLQLPDAPST